METLPERGSGGLSVRFTVHLPLSDRPVCHDSDIHVKGRQMGSRLHPNTWSSSRNRRQDVVGLVPIGIGVYRIWNEVGPRYQASCIEG